MKNVSSFLMAGLLIAGAQLAGAQSSSTDQDVAPAQAPALRPSAPRVGASGTVTTIHGVTTGFTFGPLIPAIAPKVHAPFSGVMVDQGEQTLNDGTNINRESKKIVARDSAGRIYQAREIHLPRRPDAESERLVLFTIADPVQHVFYHCSPVPKVCAQFKYRPSPPGRVHPPALDKSPDVTTEDLGASEMSGLQVEGKRVTRVIAEGMIGNDRPFSHVEETWHSKELDIDVQTKRSDPRWGTRSSTLTEVSLGEPDPSYFRIPEGYRVEVRTGVTGGLAPLASVEPLSTMNPAEAHPPGR